MSPQDKQALQLPHHKLIAYQVAAELLQLVARIRINDAELRQQARKSAKSAVLNTAEGAARQTLADKSRAYAIALAEGCECCAAVEVAGMLGACSPALDGWPHLRTVLRVQTQAFDGKTGELLSEDERYLISSLPRDRLTAQHWLLVARKHWGVETSHQILDTAFAEDDHPWIEANPRAALVVAILRRIAYTLLSLNRRVTQRSGERRATPWKTLMSDCFFALVTTTATEPSRPPKPVC